MTDKPSHDDAIVDLIRRINMNHGGCTTRMVEDFIRNLGYADPGREIRRLRAENRLESWQQGIYWAKNTCKAQGLGRWI